ncbi:T4 family baseplate hub assembly chaperone [Deminuibacter soli]|uniref:Phage baseplate protein n=1 Tax=Deminuibacter soli TaxID=2291815 RepID=A0A3E1NGG1_9BACT|nr:hypothetical protein [Deminuibacter soli]RFM26931.1 hypothetical protein DXN05_18275 [Deminuibacter soli]
MRTPTPGELLAVWEDTTCRTYLEKILQLLYVTSGNPTACTPVLWSIGERDARLLQLREWLFGSQLINLVHCPQCNELIEWETGTDTFRLQNWQQQPEVQLHSIATDDCVVHFRLPNSNDMLQVLYQEAYLDDASLILHNCITAAWHNGEPCVAAQLPQTALDAVNAYMEDADRQADIRIQLTCPACEHQWQSHFDIVSYLWIEVDNAVKHLLQETAVLAMAFGWTEEAILALSPQRRQYYLQMIKA